MAGSAFLTWPFALPEATGGDFLIATYLVAGLSEETSLARAGAFATGQSVGTWLPIPGVDPGMMAAHGARVLAVWPAGGERHLLRIAFPAANFGPQWPQLFTSLLGNDVSTALSLRLLDVEYTGDWWRSFPGPGFGVAGIRKLVGVRDRPLVLNMIKPCTGFPPEAGAELFYAAAKGGVDLIKDDELLGQTAFCPVRQRVKAYLAAGRRAYEETGHRAVYCVNISDRPDRILANAAEAHESGAEAVMVNFVAVGPGIVQALAEEYGGKLIILLHYAGIGAMTAEESGLSPKVLLGKFARLAGADAVVVMYPGAKASGRAAREFVEVCQGLMLDWPEGPPPAMPAVGGGVTPRDTGPLVRMLGPDIILAVGGAIQGHPAGATAGAAAMRRAAEAAADGQDLEEAAGDCPALAQALEIWR